PQTIDAGPEAEMKTFVRVFCSMALFAAIAPFLMAQWPAYPTPGVPKNSAGQPDLTGPAPRMPDGKPDLSGIWDNGRNGGPGAGGGRGAAAGAGQGGGGAGRGAGANAAARGGAP